MPQNTHIVTVPATEGNQVLNDEYIISPDTAMFDTRMDLSNMTEQPFLNDILHTGPSSATIPGIDFSWNAGPPSAELSSPLISPTANFDTYFAADHAIPLKRRASVASETNAEEIQGQPQVSRLVQADLYVSMSRSPSSRQISRAFSMVFVSIGTLHGSVANVNDLQI